MEKILLPTDFSDNASNAINYALEFFKGEACSFVILHVYNTSGYATGDLMSASSTSSLYDTLIMKHKTLIATMIKKYESQYKNEAFTFECIVDYNDFTSAVENVIKYKNIDLIMMGTKGASGAKEVFFGSNAVRVINKLVCPVIVIPDSYKFKKPTQILFSTDYKIDYSDKQLEILKMTAKIYKSNVSVLNISNGIDLAEVETRNKENLNKLLRNVKHEFYTVKDQEIIKAICEFQEANNSHLLMMINNKHSFFENLFIKSIICQIGFQATIPFLVIPPKK